MTMTNTSYTLEDLNTILSDRIQTLVSSGWKIDATVNHKCSPECTFQTFLVKKENDDVSTAIIYVEQYDDSLSIIEEQLLTNKSYKTKITYTRVDEDAFVETASETNVSTVKKTEFKSFIDDTPKRKCLLMNKECDSASSDLKDSMDNHLNASSNINEEPVPSIRDMIRRRNRPIRWSRKKHRYHVDDSSDKKDSSLNDYIKVNSNTNSRADNSTSSDQNKLRENDYSYKTLGDLISYNTPFENIMKSHREFADIFRSLFSF